MKPDLYLEGKRLDLAKRIGKGGEGEVYLAARLPKAVKVYTAKVDGGREAKVRAMVRHGLAEKFPLASFPEQVVGDKSGKFIGFTMRLFEGYRQLHDLYGVKSRKINFPKADYRFLLRAAANTARAVAQVHAAGCVIGDLNHSGVLVSDNATVALIDADSFQFEAEGKVHPCLVGVPEFTPPELQGKSLGSVTRTKEHDNFGLAVAIFQLLFMGRHPYAGRQAGGGDLTLDQLIARNLFAYGRSSTNGSSPPVGVATLEDMPEEIASAFERAFGTHPSRRPSASEWVHLIQALEAKLSKCSANPMHFYPTAAKACTWCRMEASSGAVLFLSNFTSSAEARTNSGPFDVERAWAAIKAIVVPADQHLVPKAPALPTEASKEARDAKAGTWMSKAFGVALMLGAVGLFAANPSGFILWLGLLAFGLFKFNENSVQQGPWINQFKEVDKRWQEALEQWRVRIGVTPLQALRADLERAVEQYRGLDREKAQALQRLQSDRHSRQLHDYLDRFLIKHASISGIGPARTMTLGSYGIESAADIQRYKVLNVPGFGPATTEKLLSWRTGLERRFVYNPAPLPADAEARARVEVEFESKRSELIKRISGGQLEMAQISATLQQRLGAIDPSLSALAVRRAQVEADLKFLGIPQPAPYIAPIRPTYVQPRQGQSVQPAVPPTSSSTPLTAASVSCPTCGAKMVRRMARRGRRSGQYFWGCSRYPSCKGTRN